jgi:RimJ/RimL family protein N-acetyltransferase
MVATHPLQPELGGQADTAVARHHRGHRLGLLLKIDMMRWLAEVEPQLKIIETWNNADNTFMINVNEALGYRLSRIFNMYELRLDSPLTRDAAFPASSYPLSATWVNPGC